MAPLQRVISGGQTGVDQVGLEVAKQFGWATGGTAPKGYRTDAGVNLDLRDVYGLTESFSAQYAPRTLANVRAAQLTVWFGHITSPGANLTLRACRQEAERRVYHWLINPEPHHLTTLMDGWDIQVLNVAGNRLRTNPQAAERAREVLTYAFGHIIPF